MTRVFTAFLFITIFTSSSNGGLYPECWIKNGECLDNNVGPLIEAVTPQINHNIVKNASMDVETLDDCAQQCFNDTECRFMKYLKLLDHSVSLYKE